MMGVGNFTEQYEQKGEQDCEGCDQHCTFLCVCTESANPELFTRIAKDVIKYIVCHADEIYIELEHDGDDE